jgi:predicted TIM-barrel fold metal-dependent hydrolase
MRVVALEEHFTVPALAKTIDPAAIAARGHYKGRKVAPGKASPLELLAEIGEKRFKSMDDAGISFTVLSNSGPGPDLVPGPDGVTLAQKVNDYLADVVVKHPKRCRWRRPMPAPPSSSAQ